MPQAGPAPEWYVTAYWAPRSDCAIDVVAFLLDEDEQVAFDEDFVFYGAPENPAGTVRLLTGGPAEQTIALNLASLPPATRKVVVAAAVEGSATFGTVGAIQIGAAPGSSGAPAARAALDVPPPNARCCSPRSTAVAHSGVSAPSARATTTASTPSPAGTGWTSPTEPRGQARKGPGRRPPRVPSRCVQAKRAVSRGT